MTLQRGFHLTVVLCLIGSSSAALSMSLSSSSGMYVTTTLQIGTPAQDFTVLVDTTTSTPFVFDAVCNLTDGQVGFNQSRSTTFESMTGSFVYIYESADENTTCSEGKDTIVVDSESLASQIFGLADSNMDVFKTELLDGALALGRQSTILAELVRRGNISQHAFTVDVASSSVSLGNKTASGYNFSLVEVSGKSDLWAFEFDKLGSSGSVLIKECTATTPCYAVIDAGSPYLSFSYSSYSTMFTNIAGSYCNETTRACTSTEDVVDYISFEIEQGGTTNEFYVYSSDFLSGSDVLIQQLDTIDPNAAAVVFLGRPFLEAWTTSVNSDTLKVYLASSATSVDKVTPVLITLGAVLGFVILFFGVFFYYNKIPPSAARNVVEEQSLLRGSGAAAAQDNTADEDQVRARRLRYLEDQQS